MKEKDLYNSGLKDMFLTQTRYEQSTKEYYKYVFVKLTDIEFIKNKDLCNFSYNEIDELYMNLQARSVETIINTNAVLSEYTDFAIHNGYVPSKINYYQMFSGKDLKKYLDRNVIEKQYITLKELYNIEDDCINPQDALIFALLFEGVKGEENAELINLEVKDCDFEHNILTLTDKDGSQRKIQVSSRTMGLIQDAITVDTYYINNGEEVTSNSNKRPIPNTEYVLRTAGAKKLGKINKQTIRDKVTKVRKRFENDYITITNIWVSGMLHYAKQLKEEKGSDLTMTDYIKINEKFGYDELYWYRTKQRLEDYI